MFKKILKRIKILKRFKRLKKYKFKLSYLKLFLLLLFSSFVFFAFLLFILIVYYTSTLPNHKKLKTYTFFEISKLYSNDGNILKKYSKEKRIFVPIDEIPETLKNAFISAEDNTFYTNYGISIKSIFYALFTNTYNKILKKNELRGASTITQQLVKNIFLTNEKTISRKIKEAILAIRITNTFSKDKILEIYLNQIFLGHNSYGIKVASQTYFNKDLNDLTIEECALLASLPKAPSKLNPYKNNKEILERRNWVITQMKKLNYITKEEAEIAIKKPITLNMKKTKDYLYGNFFIEEVRKKVNKMYGEKKLLEDGIEVYTTIDLKLQKLADRSFKKGIEDYDLKHGFRGAIDNIYDKNFDDNWTDLLNNYEIKSEYKDNWNKAVVLDIEKDLITIGLGRIKKPNDYNCQKNDYIKCINDEIIITGYIPLKNCILTKFINNYRTKKINKILDLELKKGDIIVVEKNNKVNNEYFLRQIPNVNGALLVMNPNNGKILAMVGGYIDSKTDFNRATQAKRQTGSVSKPFVYLTALENGWNPASIVIDNDIQLNQGIDKPLYTPKNNENISYGPTTLRVGLEKSRNITTMRLAYELGIKKIFNTFTKFKISDNLNYNFSIVLGSAESSLLKIINAYSAIANGGKEIQPILIEKIQDKNGNLIFKEDTDICNSCFIENDTDFKNIKIPSITNNRKRIIESDTAYQMIHLLEGVVQRGTGRRAKDLNKIIAGKTGTTNESKDAWFVGFTPNLIAGVYIGFDIPDSLGNETGASLALPIFVDFMKDALRNKNSIPFKIPNNIKLIQIDTKIGYYPTPYSNPNDIVLEAFKENDKITKFEYEDFKSEDYIENNKYDRPEIEMKIE